MGVWIGRVVLAVGVAALIAYGYLWWSGRSAAPAPQPAEVATPPTGVGAPPPPVQYPVEQIIIAEPVEQPALPPDVVAPKADARYDIDGADTVIAPILDALVGSEMVQKLLVTDRFVRRVVVAIDNLPREEVPVKRSPLRPAAGLFEVEGEGASRVIAPDNAARYAEHVALVERADSARLITAYVRLYPLFQQAYEELGYPGHYFNDRLIAVIDHLLAAPQAAGPLALEQPKILYKFADPRLEGLSAGQKMMLRIGPDNAVRVRARLHELRRRLVGLRTDG